MASRRDKFGPPKPTIYVTLPNLVPQVAAELRQNVPGLQVFTYHGTKSTGKHLFTLDRNNAIFDDTNEDNASVIVISSYGMLRARHGPMKQKDWRKQKLMREDGMNASAANERAEEQQHVHDPNWAGSLADKFGRLICDESHEIGNADTQQWIALSWLNTKYRTLMTATPLAPSEASFAGQLQLMQRRAAWSPDHLERLGVTRNFDPWDVDEDDPAALLRFTSRSIMEHIINNATLSKVDKGNRFRAIMKRLVIKRTVGSEVPFGSGRKIGQDIPPVQYITARCTFTDQEQKDYERMLKNTLDRDAMKALKDNDRSMWTPSFRRMMLLCASLKFEHMLDLTLAALKEMRNNDEVTAYQLLRHRAQKQERQGQAAFVLPAAEDGQQIVWEHARGSPKLRYLMFIVAELVVLKQEKLTVWCTLPSTQQWIESVLKEAGVRARSYRADMPMKEKTALQDSFNDSDDIEVLILPFKGASCGLNLQKSCRNMVFFDPAPNSELHQQAVGRHQRVGQTKTMRCIRLFVSGGWDEQQNRHQAEKSLVSLMTQLGSNMLQDDENVSIRLAIKDKKSAD